MLVTTLEGTKGKPSRLIHAMVMHVAIINAQRHISKTDLFLTLTAKYHQALKYFNKDQENEVEINYLADTIKITHTDKDSNTFILTIYPH